MDLLQRAEGRIRPRLYCRLICRFCRLGLCFRVTEHAELGGGKSHSRGTQDAAAIKFEINVTHPISTFSSYLVDSKLTERAKEASRSVHPRLHFVFSAISMMWKLHESAMSSVMNIMGSNLKR